MYCPADQERLTLWPLISGGKDSILSVGMPDGMWSHGRKGGFSTGIAISAQQKYHD